MSSLKILKNLFLSNTLNQNKIGNGYKDRQLIVPNIKVSVKIAYYQAHFNIIPAHQAVFSSLLNPLGWKSMFPRHRYFYLLLKDSD